MPRLDLLHWALAAVFAALLAWAAASDVTSRRIPNHAVLALVGLLSLWAAAATP